MHNVEYLLTAFDRLMRAHRFDAAKRIHWQFRKTWMRMSRYSQDYWRPLLLRYNCRLHSAGLYYFNLRTGQYGYPWEKPTGDQTYRGPVYPRYNRLQHRRSGR